MSTLPHSRGSAAVPALPQPLAFSRLHARPLHVHVAFEPAWLRQNPRARGWIEALRGRSDLVVREDDGSPCDVLHYVGFDPSFVLRARRAGRSLVTFDPDGELGGRWRRLPAPLTRAWARLVSAGADGIVATSAQAARELLEAEVSAPVRTVSLDGAAPGEPLAALYDLVACGKLQRRPWWQGTRRNLLGFRL